MKRSEEQLKSSSTPSNAKKMLQFIVDNAQMIEERMFGGSYEYFNEAEDMMMEKASRKRASLHNCSRQLRRRFNMKG